MVNLLLFIKMEIIFIYMDTSFRCYSNLHDCVILPKNKVAGILQVPYLLWILFASYLNIAIYVLN